jgi:hypothetical protein
MIVIPKRVDTSESVELFCQKKRRLTGDGFIETLFDALHDVLQVGFHDSVEDLPALFLAVEEATPLHQAQVLGSHGRWQLTAFRQFTDREIPGQQHLNHPQTMRMSQHAETLRSSPECIQVGQSWFGFRHGLAPLLLQYIGSFRTVNQFSSGCRGFLPGITPYILRSMRQARFQPESRPETPESLCSNVMIAREHWVLEFRSPVRIVVVSAEVYALPADSTDDFTPPSEDSA